MFCCSVVLSLIIVQAVPEGHYGMRSDGNREAGIIQNAYVNNTYKGLRISSPEYSLYYSVWCTNETEFFDLKVRLASSHPCF